MFKGGPAESAAASSELAELGRLCETAGISPADSVLARVKAFTPATLLGSGKAKELAAKAAELKADAVIFDDDLTPAQQRNLEKIFSLAVTDRTELIIRIFSQRARTREGKLQVELARLTHMLTRLSGKGEALEQQHGRIGTRGPGERKIEYERRALRDKIGELHARMEAVRRERSVQRGRRDSVPLPQVSIVGYTNAGKSTLLNALTRAAGHSQSSWHRQRAMPPCSGRGAVYSDDKLFATLDPTTRRVRLPGGGDALFTDTVGFIQKLPHSLVASFKATLEEIGRSDLVIHLHDLSSPALAEQHAAVRTTLAEIGAGDKPTLSVFNKVDVPGASPARARRLGRFFQPLCVSALKGDGLAELLAKAEAMLAASWQEREVVLPRARAGLIKEIYRIGQVLSADHGEQEIKIRFRATAANCARLEALLAK
ncbi:MAG: GTP-binding protein HflX [Elusimicrobia bacterium]|nr:MAG: GTP-binding protein HflX [Elusimicrobiota bacterium]KAF0156488.1 MAG: GTP-binding protein HflX [Elusimicrobiota bacterium]